MSVHVKLVILLQSITMFLFSESFEQQFDEDKSHHFISTDLFKFCSGHLASQALKKLKTMKNFFDMALLVCRRYLIVGYVLMI